MKKTYIILICCIILTIIMIFLFKNVFMWKIFFANNSDYEKDINNSIKALVLDAVKERCSLLCGIDKNTIYSEEFIEGVERNEQMAEIKKTVFCIIDADFMKTLQQLDGDEYLVIVKANYPENYYYEIVIKKESDRYLITSFLLDI